MSLLCQDLAAYLGCPLRADQPLLQALVEEPQLPGVEAERRGAGEGEVVPAVGERPLVRIPGGRGRCEGGECEPCDAEPDKASELVAQLMKLVPGISAAGVEKGFPYYRLEDRQKLAMGLRAGGLPA